MTIEILTQDMIACWKQGNTFKKNVLANMIDTVKKASMTAQGRIEITEQLVNETLQSYQKLVQDQYDKCPNPEDYLDRYWELKERKADYLRELDIVKEYAPQLITDEAEISFLIGGLIVENPIAMTKANRGSIMRLVSSSLKGKVDMAVAAKVVSSLLG